MSRKLRFGAIAAVEVGSASCGLIVSLVTALLGAGYWALVAGQLASTLTQAIGDRLLSGWRPSRPRWSPTVLPMLGFGANLTGFNVLSIFSLYSDNVLVGMLSGPHALGLFDRAFSLVLRPLGSITSPMGRIAVPLLARLAADPQTYRRTFLGMLQGLVLLGAPGLIVGWAMADEIVITLLGRNWQGAAPIISWICIAAIFTSLSASSYWIFTSQDRVHDQLRCGLVSSGLILVSMLVGLPWGPRGIAASYAAFAPVVHGVFMWVATRRGPVRGVDVARGLLPLSAGLLCAAPAVQLARLHLSGAPAVATIAAGLGCAYGATFLVLLAFKEGRQIMVRLVRICSAQR